ncbi:MAG: hypothetical protein BA872_04280 [Desulfobacterales bacterium C00003060]|nr:MAG: hypothetical protein BA861_05775 [Desulfobacterales bacterium S3730MH5]OEU79852.1 MAG: hypothetical protein BA865_08680 [Desulfobacterales bacterium S5133MH4]OEU80583.1 MAG: hypothetical protein BA872_04280 [Desulfobacterales bacterium C00003060]
MEICDFETVQRIGSGKGHARALRRQGLVPAVLYGPNRQSMSLTISSLDLDRISKESGTEGAILNLIIKNGDTQNTTAIVKEVQACPVTGKYLHIDFREISLNEEIVVNVPVKVTGKSKGVERGGFLQVVRYELKISSLPADIPDEIQIDVTDLDIGDSIHIEDLVLGDRIRLLADDVLTVVTVVAPSLKEEEIPEEKEEAEEPGESEAGEAEPTEKGS